MSAETLGLVVFLAMLSCLASWRLCGSMRGLAHLDHPTDRSLHTVPTPCVGGLAILGGLYSAILLGIAAVVSGAVFATFEKPNLVAGSWILGLTLLILVISYLDDRRIIQPGIRLAIHVVAVAGFVRGVGGWVEWIPIPLMGNVILGWLMVPLWFLLIVWIRKLFGSIMGLTEGALILGLGFVAYVMATGGPIISMVLSLGLTVLCLVWVTNLYNFMDGMDGFAGGMTLIGHAFLGYLAWQGGHHLIFALSLLVAGASCGFLIWNFPPAKIFMGDAGSVPLGFLTGTLATLGVHDKLFDVWVPVLIFSPFWVDATVTLIRRMLEGEKIWQAHRSHYYQRLVLAGWGHRRTVLAEYGLMLWCGAVAIFYHHASEAWRLVSLGVWGLVFVMAAVGVAAVEQRKVARQPVG